MQLNIHFTAVDTSEHCQTEASLHALPNETLLERFYEGDDDAFETLAARLQPRLVNMALSQLPRHLPARWELAEDLAADALIKVLRTRNRPRTRWQAGRGAVDSWMMRIIRNLMISRLRTKKGKESLGTDLEARDPQGRVQRFGSQLRDHRLDAEQAEREAEDLRQRMLEAIQYLPEELQQILLMKFDGMSHQEIGDLVGTSKSGVTRRIQAAQRTLQQRLTAA